MSSKNYKHVELFPKILNKQVFINQEHPVLNPQTQEYLDYWREEKKRCIEGWWREEVEGHWRWMFPKLYFYINHFEMLIIDSKNGNREYASPDLTDVEWVTYAYHTATMGFSGFTGDEQYTCHKLIQRWEQERDGELDIYGQPVKLTKYEKEQLFANKYVKIPYGGFKKYIDPYEYLKLHHDKPLGYPLYQNSPTSEFKMTARGTGKSYMDSSNAAHEYTFSGLRYYRNELFPDADQGNNIAEIMIGGPDEGKTNELAFKIEHGLHNFKGEFAGVDRVYPPPFFKTYQGTLKAGETYRHKYLEYVKGGTRNVTGSIIYTVNYKTNTHAGASKRLSLQLVDEAAYIEDLTEMHGVSKFSKQAGGLSFGRTVYSCTGGSFEKGDAAKKMFYSPHVFDIYPIRDYWENKGWIGLFIPATYSDRRFKDENGNTIFELALEHIEASREKLARSADPMPLIQEKMFNPLKPSEMFYSTKDNVLPGQMALERINELEEDKLWERLASVGKMSWGNAQRTTIQWKETPDERDVVIKDLFLEKYKSKEGRWVVYEHPDPNIETVRYYVVYDPYKKDGDGESYGSILVYKGFPITSDPSRLSDDIVAEYIGRPFSIDDIHKQAVMAAVYFNTKVMVERNVPGFITYCKTEKLTHLLKEEPHDAIKEVNTKKKKTKEFGINMNPSLKQHAIQLLRKWLVQPTAYDDEGNIIRYNIGKLKSLRLLHEIHQFGSGNFDHISASLLLMLWMTQETLTPVDEQVEERADDFDDFFKQRVMSFQNAYA